MIHADKTKLCPECHSTHFKHDNIHDETYCAKCGLVIVAPYCYGLKFPGFLVPRKINVRIEFSINDTYYHCLISYHMMT